MVDQTPPRPRKHPKQTRSQTLVAAIEEACVQLLQNKDTEPLTTQKIADVAGVNIASVYQYFPNKEAILASVYDRELTQLAGRSAQRFSDIQALSTKSLEQTLGAIINLEADQLLALYNLQPEFFTQYSQSYDVHTTVDEITQSMNNPSWNKWLPTFLEAHHNRLRSADIETLSFFVRNTMKGLFNAALAEDPSLLQSETFRLELLNLLTAYLVDE